MTNGALETFFAPRSVAVIGASSRPTSVGHAILKNLLFGRMDGHERSAGFGGAVFAVNPKGGEILGQPVFRSLSEIKEPVDLIVVAIPPKFIATIIREAKEVGCQSAIIISAGFAEMGEPGRALQAELVSVANEAGIRLIGPNCLGIIRPELKLNASFAAASPAAGRIGLISQSGALVTGIISSALQERYGLSAAVSLGAKADVSDAEILEFLSNDPQTSAIAIYVESFPEPREFFSVASEVAKRKPVVAIKGGTTAAGAKAASSHTGSLAGSGAAYRAAFAQSGILQAETISDFIAWSRALADQPVAPGKRIAIITNAGGPGVLAADAADRHGLVLAELSAATKSALDEVLPSVWSHNNPIDVIGDATPERYRAALDILGRATEVDGVVLIMTVQAMTDPLKTAEAIAHAHESQDWTMPILCSFMGLKGTEIGSFLDARGVPEFDTPEVAVSAMGALAKRGAWLRRSAPTRSPIDYPAPSQERASAALKSAIAAGQTNLDLDRARTVLEAAGLRYNRSALAKDETEAVEKAKGVGYPVVVKVVSPDVLHKSDEGGVILDVADADGVRAACGKIRVDVERHVPGARIDGFTIEEMVKGTEIIVGMSKAEGFGPLLMVGMGGIFVEVYKDVSFRLVPVDRVSALEMIAEIKAQPLLDGARQRPKLNRDELVEVITRISAWADRFPEIEEIDVNPLVITERGLVAIDARVIVAAQ